MITLRSWYAGRRVLVTGHTGFKGAWLTAWLRDMGANVTGVSLPLAQSEPSLFRDAALAEAIDSRVGDIRDPGVLRRAVRETKPELILHLAAQSLVRRSFREPAETFETNVMGLIHLLEAVRGSGQRCPVVVVTSDKCYENRETAHRYVEGDAFGGHDPYSASKGCAEIVAAAYRRSFLQANGTPLATARAGNVIGGGDWAEDRLVPDLVRGAMRDEPVPIRNPESVRPWQHVLDPLYGYLTLAQALVEHGDAFAEGWNLGPAAADAVTVRELVDMLQQCWPRIRIVEQRSVGDVHEAGLLTLDASKAADRLGLVPVVGLPAALDWTATWYRRFVEGAEPAARLVADDIARFERLCSERALDRIPVAREC